MDLLEMALDASKLNNNTTDIFFKRLSNYIKNKGGTIAKNKLEFHQNNQCLRVSREEEKIIFELSEEKTNKLLIDDEDTVNLNRYEPYKVKYTDKNIPFLKMTLYDMDKLTEDENIEAKKNLATRITKRTSVVERLLLMIKIKEEIVGRKKRRFYIKDEIFLHNKDISDQEVFAQLINDTLKVSGGINKVFHPHYGYGDENQLLINEYAEEHIPITLGYWTISRNFQKLRFNYYSEKRWSDEREYKGTIV